MSLVVITRALKVIMSSDGREAEERGDMKIIFCFNYDGINSYDHNYGAHHNSNNDYFANYVHDDIDYDDGIIINKKRKKY